MKKWSQPVVFMLGIEATANGQSGGKGQGGPDPGSDANFNPNWVTKQYGDGDDKYINNQAEGNKWEKYYFSS